MFDPDPHFPMQVSQGVWFCAVPACTQHRYPKPSTLIVPARFAGGGFDGQTERLENPAPSIIRSGTEYVVSAIEADGPMTGRTTAVYLPADEVSP